MLGIERWGQPDLQAAKKASLIEAGGTFLSPARGYR
jgi:hypothetical protein